jgi:hypothetical protein
MTQYTHVENSVIVQYSYVIITKKLYQISRHLIKFFFIHKCYNKTKTLFANYFAQVVATRKTFFQANKTKSN